MELLSETTINSTLHRVSTAWLALEHQWEPLISALTPIRIGLPHVYGGYARPKFGTRSFSPDLFADDWPPPKTIGVTDYLTDSDYASAVKVFDGNLHLDSYNESEVTYQAYGEDFDTVITGARTYNDTLDNLFTTYCGATYLNLTLDTTYSRTTSPDVYWETDGDRVLIEDLSDMASFYRHCFYVKDGTLHLVDLLKQPWNGVIDEFEHFNGYSVENPPPYSMFIAGDEQRSASSEYGEEVTISPVCSNVSATIQSALASLIVASEKSYFRVRAVPESGMVRNIGDFVKVYQDSLLVDGYANFRVTDMAVDIARSEIVIEGVGDDYATS